MLWCAAGILAVTLVVLEVVSGHESSRSSAAIDRSVPAPFAIGTNLTRPKRVPNFRLIDAQGKSAPLSAMRGKWIVLAPSMTLCREVCPMTTGVLQELKSTLARDGIGDAVDVVETTVDPWRDSPTRLRAYRHRFGADFTLHTS